MGFYLALPFLFLKFWFVEAPLLLIRYFWSLNEAFLQMFSLVILIKTFFKPWKNEYRKGFVGVAVGIGMTIKSFVIFADFVLFSLLLFFEILLVLFFVSLPILALLLLFL